MTTDDRATAEPVLRVTDLHRAFGRGEREHRVLRGVSFDVAAGSTTALLGANGAGKSTLLRIASTLLLPTAGSVVVCGRDVVREPREVRRRISFTGQFAAVDGDLTGRENLEFFGRLQGLSRATARRRADELLFRFRLHDTGRRRARDFSGGMRRRLDLAASLVVQPRLLFLDEPTTGLDPLARRELWEAVDDLRRDGVAILLTPQYLDEAERLADDVVLLRDGGVAARGTPASIRSRFGAHLCRLVVADVADAGVAEAALAAAGYPPLDVEHAGGTALAVAAADGSRDLVAVLGVLDAAGVEVLEATVRPPSLDEVFLGLASGRAMDGVA